MINFKNKINQKEKILRQQQILQQQKIQKIQIILERRKKINELNKKLNEYNNLNNDHFELKKKYESIIPLNVYTCWHTKELPPLMKKSYDLLMEENVELKFHLYDEEDCREFIKNNFDEDVLDAYNSLIPCSYKSDLWRFCVLYINGGIYVDIKYRCVNGFKFISLTEKEHFVRDRPDNCIYTALIATLPKNEIMKKCIYQIVENVKKKYYGNNALDPTGPGLLGSYFSSEERNNCQSYFNIYNLKINRECIIFKDTIILENYSEYRDEQKKFQKVKHYHDLWSEKNIYI
jgi:mannosyltransferase OCH1-like enzyme